MRSGLKTINLKKRKKVIKTMNLNHSPTKLNFAKRQNCEVFLNEVDKKVLLEILIFLFNVT